MRKISILDALLALEAVQNFQMMMNLRGVLLYKKDKNNFMDVHYAIKYNAKIAGKNGPLSTKKMNKKNMNLTELPINI